MSQECIILTPEVLALFDYISHNRSDEYLESVKIGYNLIVHEFGKDVKIDFSMNFHDECSPLLRVKINPSLGDAREVMEKIHKIHETMVNLMPWTYAKIVLVTI